MKPYVICHMVASVDGRTLTRPWRPQDAHQGGLFDRLHERIGGDAWLVGRVTGQEYPRLDAYPDYTDRSYTREPCSRAATRRLMASSSTRTARSLGTRRYRRGSDRRRADGTGLGCSPSRATQGWRFLHLRRRVPTGSGSRPRHPEPRLGINACCSKATAMRAGPFFAGLADEISLAIFPAVDGTKGAPSVFDSSNDETGAGAPIRAMTLEERGAGGRRGLVPLSPRALEMPLQG